MSKGFTLIELIVVTSIIVLITALTLPNYRSGDRQLALQRSAHKIAQDLRRAQEMAVSAKEFAGAVPGGYGIYLNTNQPSQYILFADLDSDQRYSGLSEKVEEITLENSIILSELDPVDVDSSLNVVFVPPDPDIVFYPDASLATVTVAIKGTEVWVSQYTYHHIWNIWGWPSPRAVCDTSEATQDCPDSFLASESDPWYVYDWYIFWFIFHQSRKFEKQESQVFEMTGKSVQINKAGLIAVE